LKALDSYLQIVVHGKARAEKSGETDYSLDDNDKILSTSSEAIMLLCRFGQRPEAEKAREIAIKVAAWVEEFVMQPAIPESANANGVVTHPPQHFASPSTIAFAYHALGTSEAHWARLSHEAALRTGLQMKAMDYFRLALHRRFGQSKNIDYQFSLAVSMAEMRDIQGAIKVVKQALADGSSQSDISDPDSHVPERKLIRFWHLLALLLSTRSDLESAAKASNAGFEQFQDDGIIFGHQEYRSEHLNETNQATEVKGLVDRMGTFEKDGILQVRITQVALLEALEGSASAVEASADLLALYARLFGGMKDRDVPKNIRTTVKTPKTAVGSSIRNSIFKRARSRRANREEMQSRATTARPSTVATTVAAPTIQVTDESNRSSPRGRQTNGRHRSNAPSRSRSRGVDPRHVQRSASQGKLHKKNSARNSMDSFQPSSPVTNYDEPPTENGVGNGATAGVSAQSSRRPSIAPSATTAGSYVTAEHNFGTSSEPVPALPTANKSSRLSIRTTASYRPVVHSTQEPSPAPSFPLLADKRYKTTILVELWLFVAGLYTRSALYDDANAAIDEAAELVTGLEADLARFSSSAKAFANRGWGGGRSIDELWGDVWAQVISDFQSLLKTANPS
jgi:hypothetical protein